MPPVWHLTTYFFDKVCFKFSALNFFSFENTISRPFCLTTSRNRVSHALENENNKINNKLSHETEIH